MQGVISLREIYFYIKELEIQEKDLREDCYPSIKCREYLKTCCEYTGCSTYFYPKHINEKDYYEWGIKYEYWIFICDQIEWLKHNLSNLLLLIIKEKKIKKNKRDREDIKNLIENMEDYVMVMLECSKLNIFEKKKETDILDEGILTKIKEYTGHIYKFKN